MQQHTHTYICTHRAVRWCNGPWCFWAHSVTGDWIPSMCVCVLMEAQLTGILQVMNDSEAISCAKSLRLCHCVFQNITQNCINSHWPHLAGVRTLSRKRNETAPAEDRQSRREQDGWEEMKGETMTPTRGMTEEKINDKKQRETFSALFRCTDSMTSSLSWSHPSPTLLSSLLPPSIHLLFSPLSSHLSLFWEMALLFDLFIFSV